MGEANSSGPSHLRSFRELSGKATAAGSDRPGESSVIGPSEKYSNPRTREEFNVTKNEEGICEIKWRDKTLGRITYKIENKVMKIFLVNAGKIAQGGGYILVQKACERAASMGCDAVTVGTSIPTEAFSFYARLGFPIDEQRWKAKGTVEISAVIDKAKMEMNARGWAPPHIPASPS